MYTWAFSHRLPKGDNIIDKQAFLFAGISLPSWNTVIRRCRNVMTDEIVYSASEVYRRLGISDSTLRKYMEVVQREGFAVRKDNRGRRQYTEYDVMVIEKLTELSKHDGMTLEKAAKMIAQRLEIANQRNPKKRI